MWEEERARGKNFNRSRVKSEKAGTRVIGLPELAGKHAKLCLTDFLLKRRFPAQQEGPSWLSCCNLRWPNGAEALGYKCFMSGSGRPRSEWDPPSITSIDFPAVCHTYKGFHEQSLFFLLVFFFLSCPPPPPTLSLSLSV